VARPRDEHWFTRFAVLRGLGLVYFVAFLSLANQVVALIGTDGLLPADRFLARVRDARGSSFAGFLEIPTIFWISVSDGCLQSFAWIGTGLALLVVFGFANSLVMGALWALYLSFDHVGQAWYRYGWESQLLETGFLAIFLVPLLDARPFPRRPPPIAVIWCLRWLIVRIMLGAGLIKIRGDDCWRDLTALYFHYETQPIPNPVSRWLHFAPHWFHQFGCLVNHAVELVAPLFAFGPRVARRAAGIAFVGFQIVLILSGNLSFLNWLTIVPALACLDDGVWRRILPRRFVAWGDAARERAVPSTAQAVVSWLLLALVAVLSVNPVANLFSSEQVMNTSFDRLHLVNTYGAFGSVGRARCEIVIEGTEDGVIGPDTKWIAYEFPAKPGDPRRRLPWISPYHYRVDWQIWFAAMQPVDRHPWLVRLLWKLLHNDPRARSLLANDPFPNDPPQFIRATVYQYSFTKPLSGADTYWTRTRLGEWIEPLSVSDDRIPRFLAAYGLEDR
jgi:lipase maturation factor